MQSFKIISQIDNNDKLCEEESQILDEIKHIKNYTKIIIDSIYEVNIVFIKVFKYLYTNIEKFNDIMHLKNGDLLNPHIKLEKLKNKNEQNNLLKSLLDYRNIKDTNYCKSFI